MLTNTFFRLFEDFQAINSSSLKVSWWLVGLSLSYRQCPIRGVRNVHCCIHKPLLLFLDWVSVKNIMGCSLAWVVLHLLIRKGPQLSGPLFLVLAWSHFLACVWLHKTIISSINNFSFLRKGLVPALACVSSDFDPLAFALDWLWTTLILFVLGKSPSWNPTWLEMPVEGRLELVVGKARFDLHALSILTSKSSLQPLGKERPSFCSF